MANSYIHTEEVYDIQHESLGRYILNSLKRRNPEEVINIDGATGNVLTCQQLIENSIRVAYVLQHLGVERGDVVSIISENTIHYCIPLLAVLYAGATVNPLNPGYAEDELKHTLGIYKPKLILCSELALENILNIREDLASTEIVLLGSNSHNELKNFKELLKTTKTDIENFEPETFDCSEQGAFIFLSSGTTGLPKGVFLTHQNFMASICYLQDAKYAGITSKETTILVLPLFHIFSVLIQFAGIAFQMKIILLDKFKPGVFLESLQNYKATKLFVVPPILWFLARSPLVDNYDTSTLRDILVGAAPVGKQLQIDATKRFSAATIRQLYGTTETSGGCTFQSPMASIDGSVGKIVPGMTAMVWDADSKKTLGPLRFGELCFKGPMIMKGYFNNAAATKLCFDSDGFYHTGDIGYYDQDGNFYVVDRLKELIKYKGFQVAPAELEALILGHPDVSDCGVIGIPDERAGQVPLAYVVPRTGTDVTEQSIAEYVAERISVQKHLYGGVVFIEEIPKNASGKILRRKLVEIFQTSC